MALHFISFKPPFCTTKAQVSPTTSPVKLSSLPATNKWNFAEENQSIPWTSLDDLHIKHAEKLKVLKHVLRNVGDKHSSKGIHMIDALQRLNIDHHFQEEIDTFLKRQYVISGFSSVGGGYDYGLHETALRFSSEQRIELTKPISFIYLIDDIFDVYGTLHELTLFTEAVTRWDINATEKLPDYMKICFKALYDLTNEISCKVYQKIGWNPIDSLRNKWASLCKAFLVEAEWFASGKLPKAEEYLKNGIVSSGVHIVLVHIFFLLGVGITKENVKIIDRMPAIVSSSATILRLWDDLRSAEEHEDFSVQRAREQVMRKISDAWKNLNKECLFQKNNNNDSFAASFLKASLNLARMVPLMYSYDDKHCLPRLEDQVKSLLYDDVLIM